MTRLTANDVYEVLRQRIMHGEFPAGHHLVESDLAAELGTSRTPVREAVRRIAAEGLVDLAPNRGARIIGWSRVEIAESYALRAELEGYGARLAAARISPESLDRLRSITDEMEDLALRDHDDPEFARIGTLNNEFHSKVVRASGSMQLASTLATQMHLQMVQQTFYVYSSQQLSRSIAHHREITEALAAGDGAWAEAIMRAHILAGRSIAIGTHRQDGQ